MSKTRFAFCHVSHASILNNIPKRLARIVDFFGAGNLLVKISPLIIFGEKTVNNIHLKLIQQQLDHAPVLFNFIYTGYPTKYALSSRHTYQQRLASSDSSSSFFFIHPILLVFIILYSSENWSMKL